MTTTNQTKQQADQQTANFKSTFCFRNRLFIVYEHNGVEYTPLKPITDFVGIDWRNIKKSMTYEFNQRAYQPTTLLVEKIDNLGGAITAQTQLKEGSEPTSTAKNEQNSRLLDIFCIRFDRVEKYLNSVNVSKIHAQGNTDTAEYLFKLQEEWADALHAYQQNGIAIKGNKFDSLKVLNAIYNKTDDPLQRQYLLNQIDQIMGINRPIKRQTDMFDDQ